MNKKLLYSLFALGAILRVAGFWVLPLWYDETFSYLLAKLPLSRLMAATMGDVHPPLHYLTIWPLIQAGLPDWAIRIPSVIFSILSLWLFWRILTIMEWNDKVKWVAFILMVINPVQLYYAQEGRMYGLLELTVLATVLCILERRYILLALVTAAMLYTDNYGLFYAACIWLAMLVYWKGNWKQITLAMAAGFVLYLPWVPTLISQTELFHGHHWIPPVTVGGLLYNIHEILMVHTMNWKALILNELAIFGLLTFGTIYSWKHHDLKSYALRLPILAFGPALIAFAFSLAAEPVLLFRNLIGSSPFLLLLIAQPAAWYTETRIRSLAMAVIVVPLLAANLVSFYRHDGSKTDDKIFSLAFDIIQKQWQPGDIVYHIGDESWLFSQVSALPLDLNYLKPNCDPVLGSLSAPTHAALDAHISNLEDLSYSRAWVLTLKSPLHPQCDYDYTARMVGYAAPVECWTDSSYDQFCIYLVNK